jgi:hypothetical protein
MIPISGVDDIESHPPMSRPKQDEKKSLAVPAYMPIRQRIEQACIGAEPGGIKVEREGGRKHTWGKRF